MTLRKNIKSITEEFYLRQLVVIVNFLLFTVILSVGVNRLELHDNCLNYKQPSPSPFLPRPLPLLLPPPHGN